MYRLFVFILILAAAHQGVHGQDFNSEQWWGRLVYEQQPAWKSIQQTDTAIIVVTNRHKTSDKLRFMSEDTGNGALMYYYIYAYKGQWHALETKNLQEAIQYLPDVNKDLVVYTEGMGKLFTTELYRGMMMASQYDVNVIMLDYPSITTTLKMYENYKFSINNAREAYKYHLPVLEEIKALRKANKLGKGHISLFFHSMGNYLIREIFTNHKEAGINDTKWVDNLILNSACVPANDHTDWLVNAKFARNIYIQYNPDDRVLKLASLPSFTTQLGNDPGNPQVKNANYVNFNKLIDDDHSYFLTLEGRKAVKPIVWEYYNTILHGDKVKLTAPRYLPSEHDGIGVDVQP